MLNKNDNCTLVLAPRHSTPVKANIYHQQNETIQTEYMKLNFNYVQKQSEAWDGSSELLESVFEKLDAIKLRLEVNDSQLTDCLKYLDKINQTTTNLKINLDFQSEQITEMVSHLGDIALDFQSFNSKHEKLLRSCI